eukprot:CAMPEP_0195292180 /NCGR_PEP_ID=MMETSP0707-20130614/8658_1 /TAXON_ID=33640 /ORGANISM="Asterionellopsis glacialis, Strain CCMP134" /LENGTH=461 /DNA_ID=CAMNT_0040352579 /DNA_START=51 /DNA_END=1436 /DNA_ORIENTATION=+
MNKTMRQERFAMNSFSHYHSPAYKSTNNKHDVTKDMPKFVGYRECKPLPPLWKKRRASTVSPCSRFQGNAINTKSILDDNDRLNNSDHWIWRTTASMLDVPPSHHPFDSAITLQNIPVEVVGLRISNFMRVNSIACKYGKYCADIHCTTANSLKFTVQLWRSPKSITATNGDKKELSVILELQRRQGCAIETHSIRNDLFNAVMTGEHPIVPNDHAQNIKERIHESPTIPSTDLDGDASDALTITLNLMKSKRLDQMQLGIESLKCLTDLTVVSQHTAKLFSHGIIKGQTECGRKLREALEVYFRNVQRPQDLYITDDDFDSSDDEAEQEYSEGSFFGAMHKIALQVLTNALEVASLTDCCTNLDMQDPFWTTAVEALVYDLAVSTHRPHEAALSARCTSIIIKNSPKNDHLLHDRIKPLLTQANDYGKKYHLNLERETEILIGHCLHSPWQYKCNSLQYQ